MREESGDYIITYHGVDGACAAAIALQARPDARVLASSARRIAETLAELPPTVGQVHVCGLGVHCGWAELAARASAARDLGAQIYWHCGRGYLDARRGDFEQFCSPVFLDSGTNTAGIARFFGLENDIGAQLLLRLAPHDHNLPSAATAKPLPDEDLYWLDLIRAGIAQYIKFQEEEVYESVVQKLALHQRDAHGEALVAGFRRSGYKHLLHGDTPVLRALKARIQRCAAANRPIIVTGESGVGKEHVAHLIWERSPRASQPFIAVNCALYAGNANLANSDLFGHKKGAFTGATRNRKGKFAAADGGILFLDELGDLPLEVQAKLLRVIEDGRIMPEGADEFEGTVDVLIVAATNCDLPEMIRSGAFRADLYHRLAALRIPVPPLRERRADIKPIVEHRLEVLRGEGHDHKLSPADWQALERYDWPGNVRQLIKLVERAVFLEMSIKEAIEEELAMGSLHTAATEQPIPASFLLPSRREDILSIDEIERRYARHAFELCGRNYSATAKALQIAPNTLRYSLLDEKREKV